MVEPRRFIRSDIVASVFGHLSALAMVLIFAEVHPFGSVTAEPITVDLVSPAEAPPPAKKEEPPPPPQAAAPDSPDPKPAALNSPPPAAPQPAAAQPQKQAAVSTPRPSRQEPNRQEAASQPQPQPQAPAAASPGYIPPQPDLSVKYNVMLGLPQPLPPLRPGGDDFDAPASKQADIASNLVTEFRDHLKKCSKLPGSIDPSDSVKVRLRVFMTTDGTLAREPILIEASASAK